MIFRRPKSSIPQRQFGTETNMTPQPIMHARPSTTKMTLSRIAIILTIAFWILYLLSVIIRQLFEGPQSYDFTLEAFSYAFVVSVLTFSSLLYLITRQGALERFSKHTRVPRAILDRYFANTQPSITVLIPSYNEEIDVIRKTILSAAFQEYPRKRIILLLDNNPNPTNTEDINRLAAARNLGNQLQQLFDQPLNRLTAAYKQYKKQSNTQQQITILADHYTWAGQWLKQMAADEKQVDHVDVFFTDQVLLKLADEFILVAQALHTSIQDKAHINSERIEQLYQRLIWTFTNEFEVFERKQYASLSHEANKAMNLNAYISLMGQSYQTTATPDGTILLPTIQKSTADITIPDSDYLLTLDADSILLREYCLRLVYLLEQPENANIAVTQTPYSSFRGAYTRIERLAGATTDIQHILHQGMTYHGATFWVGANAIIRKTALEDIAETEWINGYQVTRYIQDRTVIEDTESSIDLAIHGWQLYNYPERLSYSATPPDFGSLVVQRRRWANGGLLILPKLMTQIRQRKNNNELISRAEIMLRINYMASIAWASFGLLFLLAYPYDGRLLSPLVLLAAIPYFITMASDLKYTGYKHTDIFRIYGFNLILLPVNLAGVFKSIEQALTGKKIPFARTPKVKDRTPTALPYIILPLIIVAFSLFTFWRNVDAQNWANAAFAAFNTICATYAIIAYIGIKNLLADIWLGATDWMYVEVKPKQITLEQIEHTNFNWQSILYHGANQDTIHQVSINKLDREQLV